MLDWPFYSCPLLFCCPSCVLALSCRSSSSWASSCCLVTSGRWPIVVVRLKQHFPSVHGGGPFVLFTFNFRYFFSLYQLWCPACWVEDRHTWTQAMADSQDFPVCWQSIHRADLLSPYLPGLMLPRCSSGLLVWDCSSALYYSTARMPLGCLSHCGLGLFQTLHSERVSHDNSFFSCVAVSWSAYEFVCLYYIHYWRFFMCSVRAVRFIHTLFRRSFVGTDFRMNWSFAFS